MNSLALIKGCSTSASVIVAIGAQNAYVLKQGIMKNNLLTTALFCSLIDALLIIIGVAGLGQVLVSNQWLLLIATWGGIAFLFWYGLTAFMSSFRSEKLTIEADSLFTKPSYRETLLTLAAISLLNPSVYLDTVVLLGIVSTQFCLADRFLFAAGAIMTSFIWFFSLSFGARFLAPLFNKPVAWKVLDFIIGSIMWLIALSLILSDNLHCF